MKKQSLIDKAWKLNAKYLHSLPRYRNREIHHVFGRVGIAKCCLKLMVPSDRMHQDNWELVERLKDYYRETYEMARENFVRQLGCKQRLFPECSNCAMPRMEDK